MANPINHAGLLLEPGHARAQRDADLSFAARLAELEASNAAVLAMMGVIGLQVFDAEFPEVLHAAAESVPPEQRRTRQILVIFAVLAEATLRAEGGDDA
jgi:hypothetical protein